MDKFKEGICYCLMPKVINGKCLNCGGLENPEHDKENINLTEVENGSDGQEKKDD